MGQTSVVIALFVAVVVFLVLLILGWRKSYLLEKESHKLSQTYNSDLDENTKTYKDFTESHLYEDS